jgi:FlaA1/EpsC-like NDP-sugar epimerase
MLDRYRLQMPGFVLKHRAWFIASFQALLVLCSLVLAWLLRFDFSLPHRLLLFGTAPVLIVIRLVVLSQFGLMHGWWQYTDVSDAIDVLKAVLTGSAVFFFLMFAVLGVVSFPRSIYILEAVLSMVMLAGVRLFFRIVAESIRRGTTPEKRVLLVGAGFAGQMVIREIERPGSGYHVVGCVDDDGSKSGIRLRGVPVIGTINELPILAKTHKVDEILIAIPSATKAQMRKFVELCERTGVRFKTVPTRQDILSGQVRIDEFRDVQLEDLLGRDPVEINLESVKKKIHDRVILVTGAAGSIGSELCRQILEDSPQKLVSVDQSETGMFYLNLELSEHKNGSQLVCCVADVGDCERMRAIFAEHRPEVVFHAAAYKHVPVMEKNVQEAVKNNIFALSGLLAVAEEVSCSTFVLISSDKAVNPTSVMGVTKRVGELLVSSRPANSMTCVSVRFGNVLGSNGSVVAVLQKQLRNNEPLTITHPEIKRFFMTTREAVSLVLQAFSIGNHGDTLLLEMGSPVRILDLARTLMKLSGKSEKEVKIKFTGLREGEKLFEELSYLAEEVHPTIFPKINRIHGTPTHWLEVQRHLDQLRICASIDEVGRIRAKLKEMVPEYSYRAEGSTQESFTQTSLILRKAASVG